MNLDQLPLLDIFNSLRQRHGLPLGFAEYLVVVRSLEAGFGISNLTHWQQKVLYLTSWRMQLSNLSKFLMRKISYGFLV